MLKLIVRSDEYFNESTMEFVYGTETVLELEHSLLSISKWEQKWHKPFLHKMEERTDEESLDYIKIMTVNEVDESVYSHLSKENLADIKAYIDDPATATWFNEKDNGKKNREIITSEIIYYWMFSNQIPKECEEWHLNRLLTLIHVFGAKNTKPKKMSRRELAERNHALNAQRQASKGV